MNNSRKFWRVLFFSILLATLCGSFVFPVNYVPVSAAPQMQVATDLVISEFRFRGDGGGSDEFVEIYNPTILAVDLNGWKLNGSNSTGNTSTRYTFSTSILLQPGGHYLLANSSTVDGIAADGTYGTGFTSDGGVALLRPNNSIADEAGLSVGSAYSEGTFLPELTSDADQSYERKPGNGRNCVDNNDNNSDFVNLSPSDPQNSSSAPLFCLLVTDVNSTAADGTYSTAGTNIDITVTFSDIVSADSPTLQIETGAIDRTATYLSGSGTDTLTFRYTTVAGDYSTDLDYVSATALGPDGSIFDTRGNAILTLPAPPSTPNLGTCTHASPCSLGENRNIVINIDNGSPPTIVSIRRQNPTARLTNSGSLTFRVIFSENVLNVDNNDFVANGVNGTSIGVVPINAYTYDVTLSGGDLSSTTFAGTVGLNVSPTPTIADQATNPLSPGEPSTDETYDVRLVPLTVSITRETVPVQPPTDNASPVNFVVTFSYDIVASTFTASDITQGAGGTASGITWSISSTANPRVFKLSATAITQNGLLVPSINANQVNDPYGNGNVASTTAEPVNFNDNIAPTVTINQASGQADPTTVLPIRFTIVFSEAINASLFTVSDITQDGTATGITWTITNSGDNRTFTLSATTITGGETLIPRISANRVTDLVGNGNVASTSTDNSVRYGVPATPTGPSSIIINEVAWSGTAARTDDEWIELRNLTASDIDITGWQLYADNNVLGSTTGNPNISLSGTIPAGGYFLLERFQEATDVTADQVYSSGDLLNGGERLYLKSGTTTIDSANLDGGSWPAGTGSPTYASMERVGTSTTWVTYAGTVPMANDRNGSPIKGTPGRANWITTATVTTITSDTPDPSLVNQNVTVRVSVVGGTTTPTGTVRITGANTNCTITLTNGSGSCTTVKFSSVGTKTLTATYSGDATHPASNDTESHQVSTTAATRTPTRIPTSAPVPLVAINEFVPRPGHDWNNDGEVNVQDEYIEIINHGTIDVNLSGYSLDDEANIGSAPYRLPSVVLKPGDRTVFYTSQTGLLLSDGGDGVRLLKPNGQLMDAYNYTAARYPDQSYCRLPDNGGLDDWNQNCYPTPGLQNSLSGEFVSPGNGGGETLLCPIADTLPDDFVFAECSPYGNNIWRRAFWDAHGWYGEKILPGIKSRWDVFAD